MFVVLIVLCIGSTPRLGLCGGLFAVWLFDLVCCGLVWGCCWLVAGLGFDFQFSCLWFVLASGLRLVSWCVLDLGSRLV